MGGAAAAAAAAAVAVVAADTLRHPCHQYGDHAATATRELLPLQPIMRSRCGAAATATATAAVAGSSIR